MRTILRLSLALAVSSCGESVPPDPDLEVLDLPATIVLRVGEDRLVRSRLVTFGRVTIDARCPMDLTCADPGNAEAEFTVGPGAGDGPSHLVVLNTNVEPRSGDALGLRVTLVGLRPSPVTTMLIQRYQAELRIDEVP